MAMSNEFSRSAGAKGRIAQVLAQARASLKEPSRPITPAGFDSRMSLDSQVSFHRKKLSKIDNVSQSMAIPSFSSQPSTVSTQSTQRPTSSSSVTMDVQYLHLQVCDLKDCLGCLDLRAPEMLENLDLLLEQISPSIDQVCKAFKDGRGSVAHNVEALTKNIIKELLRAIHCEALGPSRRLLCSQLLLRICSSRLVVTPALQPENCSNLLKAVQAIYQICTEADSSGSGSSSSSTSSEDRSIAQIMLLKPGGVDVLLELLRSIWSRLAGDLISLTRGEGEEEEVEEEDGSGEDSEDDGEGCVSPKRDLGSESSVCAVLEAAMFCAGIIRSYSADETHRKRLAHLGVVERISEGLRSAGNAASLLAPSSSRSSSRSSVKTTDTLANVLVQLTGILRNLSLDSSCRSLLLKHEVSVSLCWLLKPFKNNSALVLNCARVTAKLSLLEPFRSQLNKKASNIQCIADVIVSEAAMCQKLMDSSEEAGVDENISWPSWYTWPLLSRIAFTLGNLTTTNDANRTIIGVNCKCLKPIVVLLQACSGSLSLLSASPASDGSGSGRPKELDEVDEEDEDFENGEENSAGEQELWDATIKLLRLLANLCIDETIGSALAKRPEALQVFIELLVCSNSPRNASNPNNEELLLNVVAACTNVTFYACQVSRPGTEAGEDSTRSSQSKVKLRERVDRSLVSISKHLSQCLFHDNEEIVLETARALGNLTRSSSVLQSLCATRTDEALVLLLGHSNRDVVAAVTGALVNLSADPHCRRSMNSSNSLAVSMVSVLRKASLRDLVLSSLVCQVFHNFLLRQDDYEGDGVLSLMSEETQQALADSLEELVECAEEMEEGCDEEQTSRYAGFLVVGKAVLDVLVGRSEIAEIE